MIESSIRVGYKTQTENTRVRQKKRERERDREKRRVKKRKRCEVLYNVHCTRGWAKQEKVKARELGNV